MKRSSALLLITPTLAMTGVAIALLASIYTQDPSTHIRAGAMPASMVLASVTYGDGEGTSKADAIRIEGVENMERKNQALHAYIEKQHPESSIVHIEHIQEHDEKTYIKVTLTKRDAPLFFYVSH